MLRYTICSGRMVGVISHSIFPLCSLFTSLDKGIDVLKTGCFKYAELGGQHVNELGSLLAGFVLLLSFLFSEHVLSSANILISTSCSIAPSPSLAAYYFFSVAFRAIWVMFTHPPIIPSSRNDKSNGSRSTIPQFFQYPVLTIRCVRAVRLSISLTYLNIS